MAAPSDQPGPPSLGRSHPSPAPVANPTVRLAILLAAVASLVVDVAVADRDWKPLHSLPVLAAATAGLWGLQRLFGRLLADRDRFQAAAIALGIGAGLAVPLESQIREWLGLGLPLELQLLLMCRNFMLLFIVLAGHPRLQWLGSVLSLFLVVFAASVSSETLAQALVLLYIVMGSWWLMARYWEGMSANLPAHTIRRSAWKWALVLPGLLLAVSSVAWLARGNAAGVTRGWIGSSGGDGRYDPNARSGVNDGQALVAATGDARTFGPVESEVFLDSETPSLYDVFNEQYGEPPQKKNTDRAVALPPSMARELEQRVADSGRAGSEFSTVREPRRRTEVLDDQETAALFHVSGRTPLHLRLETHDLFDGHRWFREAKGTARPPLRVTSVAGKPWIEIPPIATLGLTRGVDQHALKISRLKTDCIPTPWHPLGLHIDRVDRVEFFAWKQETVLRMEREQLPGGVVIHLQSRPLWLGNLRQGDSLNAVAAERYRWLGDDAGSGRIRALARAWTSGIPQGHAQIEEVLRRLRSECRLDPRAVVPKDVPHAAAHFLFASRRGPDHLFATSAALLLRGLGYSTRLVTGFYVDPDGYDPRTRSTPVTAADAHVWAEVYVGANTWLELEATPGYEVLRAEPDWPERIWRACAGALGWMLDNLAATACLGLTVFACWLDRSRLQDWAACCVWRAFPAREPARRVLQTVRLLDRRRRRFGTAVPPGTTTRRRLSQAAGGLQEPAKSRLQRFLDCADWAAYGDRQPPPRGADEIRRLCAEVVRDTAPAVWAGRTVPGGEVKSAKERPPVAGHEAGPERS